MAAITVATAVSVPASALIHSARSLCVFLPGDAARCFPSPALLPSAPVLLVLKAQQGHSGAESERHPGSSRVPLCVVGLAAPRSRS